MITETVGSCGITSFLINRKESTMRSRRVVSSNPIMLLLNLDGGVVSGLTKTWKAKVRSELRLLIVKTIFEW